MSKQPQPWIFTQDEIVEDYAICRWELNGQEPRCPACGKAVRIKQSNKSSDSGKCKCGTELIVYNE